MDDGEELGVGIGGRGSCYSPGVRRKICVGVSVGIGVSGCIEMKET